MVALVARLCMDCSLRMVLVMSMQTRTLHVQQIGVGMKMVGRREKPSTSKRQLLKVAVNMLYFDQPVQVGL